MMTAAQLGIRPARIIRPAPPRRRSAPARAQMAGLGASEGAIVGSAGTLATAATGVAATAVHAGSTSALVGVLGAAAPYVAIAAVVASLLAQYVGKGCGEACIDASKAEQIYEAAADNVLAAYRAGMITKAQFIAFAQAAIQAGQQHEAQLSAQKQASAGATNLTKVINALISGVQNQTDPPPAPLDLNRAQSLYVTGAGWYPDSLAAAAQLATTFLQSLPASSLPAAQSPTTGATVTAGGTIVSASNGSNILSASVFGLPLWLVAGGVALFLIVRN